MYMKEYNKTGQVSSYSSDVDVSWFEMDFPVVVLKLLYCKHFSITIVFVIQTKTFGQFQFPEMGKIVKKILFYLYLRSAQRKEHKKVKINCNC